MTTKEKDHDHTPVHSQSAADKHAATFRDKEPKCVVCGQSTGELAGKAGAASWHKFCEDARPDLIVKAKSRA
jgi:hypothetical protein